MGTSSLGEHNLDVVRIPLKAHVEALAHTRDRELLAVDALDLKGSQRARNHGHGNLEAKGSAGAQVSRYSKGLDLAGEAVGQVSGVGDEAGGSEGCRVGSPGVGVEVGGAHGQKEEIALRDGQRLGAWEGEAKFVSCEAWDTSHVQAKCFVPGGHEQGAQGADVGKIQLATDMCLGLNNPELLDLIDNNLEQFGDSQEMSDKPDRERAGGGEESNGRDHLDVVIVRVGLPVGVGMSNDVDGVSDRLDAGLAVLHVELSKSLHEKVAGLVRGSGCQPSSRSGERVKRLGEIPLASC